MVDNEKQEILKKFLNCVNEPWRERWNSYSNIDQNEILEIKELILNNQICEAYDKLHNHEVHGNITCNLLCEWPPENFYFTL